MAIFDRNHLLFAPERALQEMLYENLVVVLLTDLVNILYCLFNVIVQ